MWPTFQHVLTTSFLIPLKAHRALIEVSRLIVPTTNMPHEHQNVPVSYQLPDEEVDPLTEVKATPHNPYRPHTSNYGR